MGVAMRFAIMGSGGVGGYVGGRLAAAGEEVTLIARGAHLAAMQVGGLSLESPLGDATALVTATDDPASVGPVDLVLFAVKLYDTEAAALACRPLIGAETGVVTFQNGVDSAETLARAFGGAHVVGGVAEISAHLAEPGLIRHASNFARFTFGELDGGGSMRVAGLADALQAAGVEHRISADIRADIWKKMVFIASISGVTSLKRLPIGPVVADPDTRELVRQAVTEAVRVAEAAQVTLAADAVEQTMAFLDGVPPAMKPSTLLDLEQGRRLELPWLSGTIVRLGRELGVPTPTHALITTALAPYQNGRA
jgi:2-dehydropantoate 2-reductase